MDKQKTADYFRDKSEEEIINWMITNLSTEQIRSCLGDDIPDVIQQVPTAPIDVQTLRTFCANKPYIIHKIEDGRVYFWWFGPKTNKWNYYVKDLDQFPSELGAAAEECGPDQILREERKARMEEASSNLQYAMNVQKVLKIPKEMPLSKVFTYTPVLIESIKKKSISYYYLWYEITSGNLNVSVRGTTADIKADVKIITVDECYDAFNEILEHWMQLNDKIVDEGEAGASESYTPSKIKEEIKKAIKVKLEDQKPFNKDLEAIKTNYNGIKELPTVYFMKDLFPAEAKFGETKNYNTLEEYVENYYGKSFTKLFKPNIVENKFGLKTIHYSLR